MLEASDIDAHLLDIESTLEYLCESWWNGHFEDKWNISPQYSMMLLAEAFVRLLEVWDKGRLRELPTALLQDRLPVTLVQIVNRTLNELNCRISRQIDESVEVLAYAILTLKALQSLPWLGVLSEELLGMIKQSQEVLASIGAASYGPQYLWVEKVTYGSRFLSEAYFLAAMHPRKPVHVWTERVKTLVPIIPQQEKKIVHLFSKLQSFQSEPAWRIQGCVLEGLVFLPQLRSSSINILGGEQTARNEYLSFIPCTWVAINNLRNLYLETYLLWDMMVLTLCNFRVDEWMEEITKSSEIVDLSRAKDCIRTLCEEWKPKEHPPFNGTPNNNLSDRPIPASVSPGHADQQLTNVQSLASLRAALVPYLSTILDRPRVVDCSIHQYNALRTALHTFLNAHIDQTIVNHSFISQADLFLPFEDFTNWLHTIAGPSVSAPFSFCFLTCLIGGLPLDPVTQYLVEKFSMHVALMSRMYNDLGSLARDVAEQNVNCANFFSHVPMRGRSDDGLHILAEVGIESNGVDEKMNHEVRLSKAKARLEKLAIYERDAAELAGARLMKTLLANDTSDHQGSKSGPSSHGRRKRRADAISLFLGVAELYADIYAVKDLSNRQHSGQGQAQGLKRKRGNPDGGDEDS